jgi:hypothetical protein
MKKPKTIKSEVLKSEYYEAKSIDKYIDHLEACHKQNIDFIKVTSSELMPLFEDFRTWYTLNLHIESALVGDDLMQIYSYFKRFKTVEVFPEVGKEYEFSEDGENWRRDTFESYESNNNIGFTHIRPIKPSRLEQLKSKHPNLTQEEQAELLDLLLTED